MGLRGAKPIAVDFKKATGAVAEPAAAGEIEFALLAPAPATLEGTLISLLGTETGLTGYMALAGEQPGRGGFLLLLRAGADRTALIERLELLGLPAEQLTGRVFPPSPEIAGAVDNLEMLIGLMDRQQGARRIGPDRRALRRVA